MTRRSRRSSRGGRLLVVLLVALAVIALLAVVLAMLVFVFLPVVTQQTSERSPSGPPVVTTTRYGNISELQLQRMRRDRQVVLRFLAELAQAYRAAGGEPSPTWGWGAEFGPRSEEAVVDAWLLACRAEDLGIMVSDRTANAFLAGLTQGNVPPKEITAIVGRLGVSEEDLFAALRRELLALKFRQMFHVSLVATPPAQRWDYYQRLNRQVTIEAAIIPVAGYVDEVADPDEATLRAFFERYKAELPHPALPEPGFREPHKVAVEYLKAELEGFVDPGSVTDKEIKEEYETFKDDYYRRERLLVLDKEIKEEYETFKDDYYRREHLLLDEEPSSEAEPLRDSVDDADGPSAPGPPDQDEYLPLEEVDDQIRRRLTRKKAQARIEEVLDPLRAKMARYHDERILYEVQREESPAGEAPAPPPRPDFPDLAKQHGLTAHKTGLISALEARELDIGRSYIGGRLFFTRAAFEDRPLYLPEISQDVDGDSYLYWKVDEAEERIPDLEETGVRGRVLWAWKMKHARHLALKEAERLAAEARSADQSLEESLGRKPGVRVVQTEPFSWLTYGDIPAVWAQTPPRISEVKGVVYPGDEFMRAVFDLEEGEIGTAVNQPKTAVYVVRVIETVPDAEILFRRFLAEGYIGYFRVAYYDQIESERAWLDEIKSATGFRWKREPVPEGRP